MTNQELAAALRLCGGTKGVEECRAKCPFCVVPDPVICIPKMTAACADALENTTAHVAALQKEIEGLRAQLTTAQSQNEQLREAAALTVKATTDRLCREWVSVKARLPDREEDVLTLVSGKFKNCTFDHAYMVGLYAGADGWIVNEYPDWENPGVTHWMPLPDGPKEDA